MTALAPRLITAPTDLPVSVAEAKAHVRVDHADEDAPIEAMLRAAVSHIDGYSGRAHRALVTQTWEDAFAGFEERMFLAVGPVASITSVTYEDASGADATVSASDYSLLESARGYYIKPKPGLSWPDTGRRDDAVRVRYVAGTAAGAVPPAIKAAVLLVFGDFYAHRETTAPGRAVSIPVAATVDRLLAPYQMAVTA